MSPTSTPDLLRRVACWVFPASSASSHSSLRHSLTAVRHLALHRHCSSRLLSQEFDLGLCQQAAPIPDCHEGFAAQPLTRAPTAAVRACSAEVFASHFAVLFSQLLSGQSK